MADTRCYLLELPPELRLNIYEYVFGYESMAICSVQDDMHFDHQEHKSRSTAILRTNKEISSEAVPILYACTSFRPALEKCAEDPVCRIVKVETHHLQRVKRLCCLGLLLSKYEDLDIATFRVRKLARERNIACAGQGFHLGLIIILGKFVPPRPNDLDNLLSAIMDMYAGSRPAGGRPVVVQDLPTAYLSTSKWREHLGKVDPRRMVDLYHCTNEEAM
ncbi:hypothetical protein Tdes44962_MAKER04600 [Teratosphaeria destructans]|uniref:F-box domain-containing protein n=1 Tax=Teratosphaeria destructans TaxID=418781 RepID=A0A9W7SMN8_9PEZI|nr:hypothetical protein Tdes44962_MAKER04600 [Teratosphaeria destructans]